MDNIIKQIFAQAKQLDCCDKFNGSEDLQGIIQLFKSPQGLEFCINNHFPHISTLRQFKPYNVGRYGIYIDAGEITLSNPGLVLLIGNTTATLNCSSNKARNEVVLMHGAKAVINASEWSVTFIKVERGSYIKNIKDHAIVL